MGSGLFSLLLIAGIVLYVTGAGGYIALGLMAIGGIGLVVTVSAGKK